jgi:hypothetical protein
MESFLLSSDGCDFLDPPDELIDSAIEGFSARNVLPPATVAER